MSKIYDNLFLGDYEDAKNDTFLKKNNITHIVTVGAELRPWFPLQYKYLYIMAHDMPQFQLGAHFDKIADFIHNAIQNENGAVFVHCFAGISRSSSSVIAYLIKYKGMGLMEAKNFVKFKRGIIWPNAGFMRQLEAFSLRLRSKDMPLISKKINESGYFSKVSEGKMGDARPREFDSFFTIKNSLHNMQPQKEKVKIEVKKEKFDENEKFDYFCRKCKIKLFSSDNILHNTGRVFNAHCNAIYLNEVPWTGAGQKGFAKIMCPNSKCADIIGFQNLKSKCGCKKDIAGKPAIYPLRVAYVKI